MAVNESLGSIPADRSVARATGSQWEDLRFPAQGINPPGAASDPTFSNTAGVWMFSGGPDDNVLIGAAQMPHSWEEGTAVVPHLHLRFPTAAAGVNSRWKLEYDIASPSGSFANAHGSYSTLATITTANPNDNTKHVLASFGNLAMIGHTVSAVILWKLTRVKTDVLDTDTSDVALLELDFHYQKDSLGSAAETTK